MELMAQKASVTLASTCYRFRGVTVDANNKGVLVGAGGVAVGTIQGAVFRNASNESAYAAGANLDLENCSGEQMMEAGGAFTCADFLKWGTGGKLVVEASATTRTVNTVAIARQTSSGDGAIVKVFFTKG